MLDISCSDGFICSLFVTDFQIGFKTKKMQVIFKKKDQNENELYNNMNVL